MSTLKEEFVKLQKELLYHKYMYYMTGESVMSDYEYDLLENKSWDMAKKLGYKADKWEDPDEDEKDHIHHMVGFDANHPYAKEVLERVNNE